MSVLLKIYAKLNSVFIGEERVFSLEHRVFNLFSFFVCLVTIVAFFLNLAFNLYESAILSAVVCLIQSIILYISRVEKKFKIGVILTGVELYAIVVANYFINGGIGGPTTVLFLAVLFLMSSIVERKHAWIWLLLNLFLIGGLFCVEYFRPASILIGYNNRLFVFLDVYASYIMVVVLMTTGVFYKRRAFEKQRKALEAKALALEKLNSEKSKLFSIISHDLRAPVGSVKQYLSFIKEHHLTEEEKRIIEDGLIKSTNEAYELLDNLLVWAKSQMGGSRPFVSKLKASEVLPITLANARDCAKEKNISITDHIEDLEFLGDENMLRIVVRNLLLNAIKFTGVGGEIVFSAYAENGRAVFSIADKGVGISEDDQKKIFSLDIKSNIGTKKEKGTGLGLVLCKEYTQLQNGTIYFKSEHGKGSTFFVSLPLF